jgi:DeoR/GlpR family transcriptional regulator of sugar metabolism
MSTLDSSGAVDGGRIRRRAAVLVRERSLQQGALVTALQDEFDVSERTIRDELNKCFDAALLYRQGHGDDAEVVLP